VCDSARAAAEKGVVEGGDAWGCVRVFAYIGESEKSGTCHARRVCWG
jgi:hypothetical protein